MKKCRFKSRLNCQLTCKFGFLLSLDSTNKLFYGFRFKRLLSQYLSYIYLKTPSGYAALVCVMSTLLKNPLATKFNTQQSHRKFIKIQQNFTYKSPDVLEKRKKPSVVLYRVP